MLFQRVLRESSPAEKIFKMKSLLGGLMLRTEEHFRQKAEQRVEVSTLPYSSEKLRVSSALSWRAGLRC